MVCKVAIITDHLPSLNDAVSDDQTKVLVGVLRLLEDYSAKYLKYQCVDSRAIMETTCNILQKAVGHFVSLSSNSSSAIGDVSMAILSVCTNILASVHDPELIDATVSVCYFQGFNFAT